VWPIWAITIDTIRQESGRQSVECILWTKFCPRQLKQNYYWLISVTAPVISGILHWFYALIVRCCLIVLMWLFRCLSVFAWLDRQKLLHCLPCWYIRHELQSALQVYEWWQVSSQRWSVPLSARMDRCTVYRKWVPPGSNAGLDLQFIGIYIHCSVFFHCSVLLIPCSAFVHIMLPAQSLLMLLCFGKKVHRIVSGQCHILGCGNFNADTYICVLYAVTISTAAPP